MPQARALGRTAAGRTNRSLAAPRREDGCFETGSARVHHERERAAAQQLAATQATVHPSLSSTMLRPVAAAAMSRLPREALAGERRFPEPDGFSHAHAPRMLTHVEGVAPARVPAHVRWAAEVQVISETPVRASASAPSGSAPALASPAASKDFNPASLSNFGDGAGVAGTRGQRWLPKNGARVTDFLLKLHEEGAASASEAAASASEAAAGLSPAELLSLSMLSPRQKQQKLDFAFSNIRPETPRCAAPVHPRGVRQVVRPPPPSEQIDAAAQERDMRAVRGAIKKLGAAAGYLNQRTWFKGVEGARGHGSLSADAFLALLPQLDIHLTAPQEKLLTSLTFDGAQRADFLTLLPRLLGGDDFHASEIGPFLQYWKHLPTPPAKQDPDPTALHTLQQLKEHIDTRGLHSVLRAMGFSSRGSLPRARFAQAVRDLSIHLPPDEEARLLAIFDPAHTDQIAPAQIFALADVAAHQLQRHHRVCKLLADSVVHVSATNGPPPRPPVAEECKEQAAPPHSAGEGAAIGSSLFERIGAAAAAASASSSSARRTASLPTTAPPSTTAATTPLALSMIPPMFQSVHSARTTPIARIAPPAESETARAPPTRFQRTHAPLHTPISSTGGIGRPLSAASHQRAQTARAAMKLPPVQTLPLGALPLYRLGDRAALDPTGGATGPTAPRNGFYAPADERFTPRDQALREMQEQDKMSRSARLRAIGQRLDANESRVLGSYESHALAAHKREATSVVDKIQQKRQYMTNLRDNYTAAENGTRRVHQAPIDPEVQAAFAATTTTAAPAIDAP